MEEAYDYAIENPESCKDCKLCSACMQTLIIKDENSDKCADCDQYEPTEKKVQEYIEMKQMQADFLHEGQVC